MEEMGRVIPEKVVRCNLTKMLRLIKTCGHYRVH